MLSRLNKVATADHAQRDGATCPDGELIDRTLAGESEAFGFLVRRYQDRLYNTLVHVGGSDDEAREVVQEAFVQAYVNLGTFQRAAAFYTWLYRIALNLRIGHKRRERRRASLQMAQRAPANGRFSGGELEQRDAGPSAPLESAECVSQVRAAIRELAADHREVVLLREIEGCCYDEIARMLDIPVGTVRSRLHRARAQLREQLQGVYREQLQSS
jgi:RNA polymerase sigma-70 factor (ECF subfamily)